MGTAEHRAAWSDEDRTARARIRDAAIVRFAGHGVRATSVKAIAADAGVSPALVFHHYDSKDGLRAACDARVVAIIEEQKLRAVREGPQLDVFASLRESAEGPPILRYLARMLTQDSAEASRIVDGLVDLTVATLDEGVRSGVFLPVEDPRELSVVLVLWSLGLLVLRDQAERLFGADITGSVEQRARYVRVAMDALRGLFTEEAYEHGRRALAGDTTRKAES